MRLVNSLTKEEYFMYFDELSVLVVDNRHTYIHVGAINKLLDNDVTILICDEKHMPHALIASDYGYYKKLETLKLQIALSKKVKDRLWQKIVKFKIANQLSIIRFLVAHDKAVEFEFAKFIRDVEEGDSTMREALAARLYFPVCFGKDFKRGRYKDKINAALNYSYAITRAIVRKTLIAHGFEPALGIKHAQGQNPFNLSDDIIEAYRPLTDAIVIEHIVPNTKEIFEEDDRFILIEKTLTMYCIINDKSYSLHDAINVTIESLKRCIENNSSSGLLLPKYIEP